MLDQARVELARTVIRAPIDGVVIARNVSLGQTVAASLEAPTLFTIAGDLRRMELHARVDEADIGRVRVGRHAEFRVDAYPERVYGGEVTQVRKSPERMQNVVTYTVLISVANDRLELLPGMTAVVEIVTEERSSVPGIPNAALRFVPDASAPADRSGLEVTVPEAVAWVVDAIGRPVAVPVVPGASDMAVTEIAGGGLGIGDRVIVAQQDHPRRGALAALLGR